MNKSVSAIAALTLLASSAGTLAREAALPPSISRAMAQFGIPASSLSIYVRDANSDDVVIALNADTPRSPASTIKVLTTFAALDMLGPAYTWKTRAYAEGRLGNGVLTGDLILVGGGDPYMTSERWWSFVQGVRELGLAKITGDVVIDNSYFAPASVSRADFDDQPYRTYNVLPDALMVNFQTSRFIVTPNAQRTRPLIVVSPLPSNLEVKNQLRVGPGKCQGPERTMRFDTPVDSNVIVLSGVVAAACGQYAVSRAIMNAPDYAYGTFRTFWSQSGGAIDGGSRLEPLPPDAKLIYEFDSLPLAEIIRLVNKYSNNVMARHLLLTLGAEKSGVPATMDSGREAIASWLSDRDIKIPGFVLDNGSGLSRAERVTVRGLGDVLDVAWHSPFMPELAASLPLSATDGTLRSRFRAAGMQGRLRLKTGTLDHVSGLAGFVNSASGKTYIVVILVNHRDAHTGTGEAVQAELIRWVFGQ